MLECVIGGGEPYYAYVREWGADEAALMSNDRYVGFAEDYYEIAVDRAAVEHVVARLPLTDAVVRALNPETSLAELRADVPAIGYPVAAQ